MKPDEKAVMRRFYVVMIGLGLCLLVVLAALALVVRQLRQDARARYYQNIAATQKGEITITIPEGYRREQIAALLEEKGVTSAADFIAATANDEGRLFPDTYRFFPGSTANSVRDRLLATYDSKTASLGNIGKDALSIASIVEREARTDSERADVAGVYWNRLNAGFNLGADPTVQYGKETNDLAAKLKGVTAAAEQGTVIRQFNFWQPITRADYTGVDSLYNTYEIATLPPGPICNPGVASITAALHPSQHQYYYFLYGKDGKPVYAKTLQEHNRNVATYL